MPKSCKLEQKKTNLWNFCLRIPAAVPLKTGLAVARLLIEVLLTPSSVAPPHAIPYQLPSPSAFLCIWIYERLTWCICLCIVDLLVLQKQPRRQKQRGVLPPMYKRPATVRHQWAVGLFHLASDVWSLFVFPKRNIANEHIPQEPTLYLNLKFKFAARTSCQRKRVTRPSLVKYAIWAKTRGGIIMNWTSPRTSWWNYYELNMERVANWARVFNAQHKLLHTISWILILSSSLSLLLGKAVQRYPTLPKHRETACNVWM